MEMAKQRFGERVREIRRAQSMSQDDLAAGSELDRTYIGGVERGERNISLINILKIAKALGIHHKELMDFDV
jgi:transcriptional regulator with XRE-family HTH domain